MDPFSSGRINGLTLRNRVIKAATYEGMTPMGIPSAALTRHHLELARGGVGMTTVAYCAVSQEGRTFEGQLWMRPEAVAPLRALTEAVHAAGAAVSLQLAHCGSFTRNPLARRPLAPSARLNPYGLTRGRGLARAMDGDDRQRVAGEFAAAALRAREAGFDAVELHLGHGYLLSQYLSPWANRRRDEYGGPLENRLRFPLEVVREVRAAVGPAFPVLAKTNLRDGFAGGLEVDEAVEIARQLERNGVDAVVLSGGFVSRSAMFLMRGERPLRQMIEVERSWLQKGALAVLGPVLVPRVPFTPMYFLEDARRVRAAVKLPLVLLGGVTDRAHLLRAMDEGFDFVAMGRALLHDPTLVARYRRGEGERSGCEPCNQCMAEMDRPGGVVCVKVPAQAARRAEEVGRAAEP